VICCFAIFTWISRVFIYFECMFCCWRSAKTYSGDHSNSTCSLKLRHQVAGDARRDQSGIHISRKCTRSAQNVRQHLDRLSKCHEQVKPHWWCFLLVSRLLVATSAEFTRQLLNKYRERKNSGLTLSLYSAIAVCKYSNFRNEVLYEFQNSANFQFRISPDDLKFCEH
jgi:hypothetical protein